MMPSAAAISSGMRTFLAPAEPFVSTLMEMPRFFACCSRLSAAIKVCAMPVGQAVTARIWMWSAAGALSVLSSAALGAVKVPFSFASMRLRNSSTVLAAMSASLKSGSIIMVARLERMVRCSSFAPFGAAIMKKRRLGLPSIAAKSIPSGMVMAASPAVFTPSLLACGVAMPSPRPVVPLASRASTSLTYCSLSLRFPPFSMQSASRRMAASLEAGAETPRAMLSGFKRSLICKGKTLLFYYVVCAVQYSSQNIHIVWRGVQSFSKP